MLKCEQRNVRLESKKKVLVEVKAMEKQVARVLTPLGYCGSNNSSKKNNVTYRRLAMFHQLNKCCFQGTDFEHAFSDEEKKMTEQKSATAGRSEKKIKIKMMMMIRMNLSVNFAAFLSNLECWRA